MKYKRFTLVVVILLTLTGASHLWGETYYTVSEKQTDGTYQEDLGASFSIFTCNMNHVMRFSSNTRNCITGDYFAGFYSDTQNCYCWNGTSWVTDNSSKTAKALYDLRPTKNADSSQYQIASDLSTFDIDISEFTYSNHESSSMNINLRHSDKDQFPYIYPNEKGIFILAKKDGTNIQLYTFRDTRSVLELYPDTKTDDIWTDVKTYLDKDNRTIPLSENDRKACIIATDLYETLDSWMNDENTLLSIYPYSEEDKNHPGKTILRKYLNLAFNANTNFQINKINKYENFSIHASTEINEGSINNAIYSFSKSILGINGELQLGNLKWVKQNAFILWVLKNAGYEKNMYWPEQLTGSQNPFLRFWNYITGSNHTISREEIIKNTFFNNCSVIVPELDSAELGDIVITTDNSLKIYGIISQKGDTLETVKVIYLHKNPSSNEDVGIIETDMKSFLMNDCNPLEIRRLLVASDTDREVIPSWDVLNPAVCDSYIEIGRILEETQTSKSRFTWIPNTGEYLMLSDINVKIFNKAGVLLKGDNYKVCIETIKDRNYDGKSGTLITNNRAQSFQVVIGDNQVIYSKPEQQRGIYTAGCPTVMCISGKNGRLRLSGDSPYVNSAVIKIRPVDSAHAFPGDDLILVFQVYTVEQNGEHQVIKTLECKDSDVLSVYDKKMVWRANLYMNDDGQDWNDEHPWNVPAKDGVSITGVPSGWNADAWGYNEWNRTYKAEVVKDSDGNFSSVNMVWGDGNGGQTITLADSAFTPVRSQGSPGTEGNVIRNSVAYDYDYSESGYANAWDSPFDFAYKMYQQKLSMVTHFKTITDADPAASTNDAEFPNGKTPSAPIAWEVNSAGTAIKVTNGNLNSWNGSTEAPMHFWKFYWKEESDSFQPYIPGLGLYMFDTHVKGKLTEPEAYRTCDFHEENLWASKNPLDPAIKFNAKKSAGTDCIGFVERSASYRNTSDARNKKRIYTWQTNSMMPVDMAEAEGHNLNETTLRCNNKLVYPYNKTDHQGRTDCEYSTLIVSREEISNMQSTNKNNQTLEFFSTDISTAPILGDNYKGPSPENFKKLQNKFLSIVPGDVIFYGGLNSAGTTYSGHHIGEIANVDYTMIRNATTINQLLQSVTVIECVFNGKVNYVIKRNMLGGSEVFFPSVDNFAVGETQFDHIYRGSWMFDSNGKNLNNLRNWEIRRLR